MGPPPVLARFNSENRHSQKYVISAGEEEGEERGSSGTSRAIPNIVSSIIPNASFDPFADEFTRVVEGDTDPNLPYHKLKEKITYNRIYYNPDTKQYRYCSSYRSFCRWSSSSCLQ